MQKPNDRHLGFMQLVVLEKLAEDIQSHHGLNVALDGFVPSFCHVRDQV